MNIGLEIKRPQDYGGIMKKMRILYILIILGIVITSATAYYAPVHIVEIKPLNRTGVPANQASETFFYFNNENMTIQVILDKDLSGGAGNISATFSPSGGSSPQTVIRTTPNSSSGGNYTYYLNFTVPNTVPDNSISTITITAVDSYSGDARTFVALLNINPETGNDLKTTAAGGATNWSTIPDYTNAQNLTFTKYSDGTFAYKLGSVEFLENLNLADQTTGQALQSFGTNMKMSQEYMDMNTASSALAALNKSAKLTMFNLTQFEGREPGVLVNGVPAYKPGGTYLLSYISGFSWSGTENMATFNTAHWSNNSLQDKKTPTISSVASSSVTTSGATITWTTDLFADTLVKYGTTSVVENMTNTATGSTSTKSHSVTLTGLSASTTYYYVVNSTNSISTNTTQNGPYSFTTSASSNGGGGSGGGGTGSSGVTTSELPSNIEKAERHDEDLAANMPTTYSFTSTEHGISQIVITGKENENEIAVRVEALKGTSKGASTSAPGTVYRNLNIIVGTKKIKEAIIKFKIENSWLNSNNLDASDVRLVKWDGSKWIDRETAEKSKDDSFTYFEAKTDSFSSFAITGLKAGTSPTPTTTAVSGVTSTPLETNNIPTAAPTKKASGFGLVLTAAALGAVSMFLRKRR